MRDKINRIVWPQKMKALRLGISLLLVLFIRSEVKCQELLNANVKQIKEYMKGQQGILKKEVVTLDIITNTQGNQLMYEFPSTTIDRTGIFIRLFMFSPKGVCIHYMTGFSNVKYMPALIARFDNPKSDYKRINKDLNWTLKTNDKVMISIMTNNSRNNGAMFTLDIQQKNGNPPYKPKFIKELEKAMKQVQAEKH